MRDFQIERIDAAHGLWFVIDGDEVSLEPETAVILSCESTMPLAQFIDLFDTKRREALVSITATGGKQVVRFENAEYRFSVGPALDQGRRAGEIQRLASDSARGGLEAVFQRRFQALADILPVGIMLLDGAGQPFFANASLHAMLSLPDSKIDPSLAFSLIHSDDQSRVDQSFARYLGSDRDEWTERYRVVSESGRELQVESRCQRERDSNGASVGFICTVADLAPHTTADKENEDDPMALGLVGHWSWSASRREIVWSDSMCDIYGLEPGTTITQEIATKNIPDIQVELLQLEIDRARREGRSWEFEHDILLDNGTRKRVLSRGRSFSSEQGERLAGTVIDVTEQREREQKTRQAEKLRAIGQLASGVAHDFNNMLGAIVGNATVLAEEVPPALQRPVAEIQVAAERVARLTRQLLTFSRSQQIDRVPTNVHELLDEVYTLVAHSFSPRITVKRQFLATESTVVAEPSQLQSSFLNLLVNARDALSGTIGQLDIITRNVEDGGARAIEIIFSDNGPGMSEETRRRAFEPFYTTRRDDGGTGLGLSATYGAVLRHGGTIGLESELGEGTTFTIRLQTLKQQDAVESATENRGIRVDGTGTRVWVVDDEPLMRSLAARVFKRARYEVTAFQSGEEVLEAAAQVSPDVLLVDHHMPGISGTELVERLRAEGFDKRIIMVTGNSFELDHGWAERLGVREVVEKPYEVADLLSAVSDE